MSLAGETTPVAWTDPFPCTLEDRLMEKVNGALQVQLKLAKELSMEMERRVQQEYADRLDRMALEHSQREEELRDACRSYCENWSRHCHETCLKMKNECDERIAQLLPKIGNDADLLVLD